MADPEVSEEVPDKPASDGDLLGRLRGRLKLIGGALASVAAVGAVASGLLGYWNVWKTVRADLLQEGQKTQREAAARPDIVPRLSLVVLPFVNLNNDPEQDYFADGVTTDLTTDLAQMPGAFVIGRGTAFTYKNRQIDPKILGKELGIRWAVQGAVRRNGNQVRVNISLTDLSTGLDVWSDRFDGDRENILAMQDQITARLARSLNVELIYAESHRSEKSKNPDAMDFNMRGWAKFYEPRSKAQIAKAREMFEAALQIDPENVDATIGEAWCLMQDVTNGFSSSPVNDQRKAIDLVNKVLPKNPANVLAHVVKGDTLRYGHPEESLAEYNAVLDIDPNFAVAYGLKGTALTVAGRARETFSPVESALRLSPKDPFASGWHYNLCHAHVHLHEYKEAIEGCRRSINMKSLNWYPYADLIVAYEGSGQPEQARQMLAELYRIRPDFTVQWYRQLGYGYSSNPQFRRELDDILDGLRKGGVREQ